MIAVLASVFFLLIASIDLRYRRIPDALVWPAMAGTLLLRGLPLGKHTLATILGGLIGLLPFLLVALHSPGTLGGGDVKLAALIGLMAGFPQVLWPICLGILAGAAVAIALILAGHREARSQMPYAPFLCLGALISLLYNPLS